MKKKILSLYLITCFLFSCKEQVASQETIKPDDCYANTLAFIPEISLSRFEDEIITLENKDLVNGFPRLENPVVFYGSSSIRYWNNYLSQDFPQFPVMGHGFGGATFNEMIYYSNRLLNVFKPKTVVLYSENDPFFARPKSNEQILADLCYLTNEIHSRFPKAKIFLISLKHSPYRRAAIERFNKINGMIKEYSSTKSYLKYIDINPAMYKSDQKTLDGSIFQSDSLHMNRKGYERWISIIKPILEADYKSR